MEVWDHFHVPADLLPGKVYQTDETSWRSYSEYGEIQWEGIDDMTLIWPFFALTEQEDVLAQQYPATHLWTKTS